MSDFTVFTPETIASHDAVVERNLRLFLATQIQAIQEADDLLGNLLRMETSMAEGARMALEIAVEVILDDPVVRFANDEEEEHASADR